MKATAEQFALSVATGKAREIACFGARGDGKTWAALWAMVMHAVEHHAAGFPLPTTWIGLRDTHRNHILSTKKSMTAPHWPKAGHWAMSDGDHLATFLLDGVPWVRVELIGADSPSDAERVRTEAHGVWVDEPAPAMDVSNGISDDLYFMASSSARLETHARMSMITSNYPDSEHWLWQRFVEQPQPGTMYFRIPPGERASAEYRAELKRMYATRPDLARRLVEGRPGALILGEQVAVGFNEDLHAPYGLHLRPEPGVAVAIGQDGGLTPTSVIGQRVGQHVRILASLHSPHDGILGHFKGLVRPWLAEHTPWALTTPEALRVYYDPSMNKDGEGDVDANALKIMRRELGAAYWPGAVKHPLRLNPILAVFNALSDGQPVLQIDPVQAKGLVRALSGGWHYATGQDGKIKTDEPVKDHPYSDYGDAFAYLIGGLAPLRDHEAEAKRYGVTRYAQSGLVDYRDVRHAGHAKHYAASRLT